MLFISVSPYPIGTPRAPLDFPADCSDSTMKAPLALVLIALAACGDDPKTQTPPATSSPVTNSVQQPAAPATQAPALAPVNTQGPITSEVDLLKEVIYVLRNVKSLDQAKAAHETLTKMGQRAQPLIDKHKQLYAGPAAELQAKAAALKSSLAAGIPLLHAETDRIQQIQGARDVLEAPLTKIIALLNPQV